MAHTGLEKGVVPAQLFGVAHGADVGRGDGGDAQGIVEIVFGVDPFRCAPAQGKTTEGDIGMDQGDDHDGLRPSIACDGVGGGLHHALAAIQRALEQGSRRILLRTFHGMID